MARPKKRVAEETKASTFLDALKYLSLITKEVGTIGETHVWLGYNWAVAFNGVLAAGHKIKEEIQACPNNKLMLEALSKCGEYFTITQLDNGLSVKSNKFKAIVPCIDQSLLALVPPDEPIAIIDDRLKQAFEAVSIIPTEANPQQIYLASILLNGQSLISTDGKIIIEYWHGIDLPPNLPIPKAIIQPIIKSSKKLCRFGFSQSSVTFYYEDGSWIRSQLYAENWPDTTKILSRPTNPLPLPPDFFKGIAAVMPWSENGLIFFGAGVVQSHETSDHGASYEVPGLVKGPIFNGRYLTLIKDYAETVDFQAEDMLIFYGKSIRGGIAANRSYPK